LLADKKALEKQVAELRRSGGGDASGGGLLSQSVDIGAHKLLVATVPAPDVKELQAIGDGVRDGIGSGVGVLGASFDDGKAALVIVVSDALREKGVAAGDLVKAVGAKTGIRGGGKPHMAQAGVAPDALAATLDAAREIISAVLAGLA
jgi:alanyl-tRNA synthetase